jgi:hypothetical protein
MQKNEISPREDETPEQTTKGAPGGAINIEEGTFKICTALNNFYSVVDMSLAGDSNRRHNVKLYNDNWEPESKWAIVRAGGVPYGYLLINKKDETLVMGEATNNSVIASPSTGRPAQIWRFKDAGGGLFYIENQYDFKVMDVKGSSTAMNTDIINYPYTGGVNQKFKLKFA